MHTTLRNHALMLALLGGAAWFAAPAFAADLDNGDFGGTYRYIGPGAASQPDFYAGPPYGPETYAPDIYAAPYADVPPDMAEDYVGPYGPPVADYAPPVEDYPDAGLALVAPGIGLFIGD